MTDPWVGWKVHLFVVQLFQLVLDLCSNSVELLFVFRLLQPLPKDRQMKLIWGRGYTHTHTLMGSEDSCVFDDQLHLAANNLNLRVWLHCRSVP